MTTAEQHAGWNPFFTDVREEAVPMPPLQKSRAWYKDPESLWAIPVLGILIPVFWFIGSCAITQFFFDGPDPMVAFMEVLFSVFDWINGFLVTVHDRFTDLLSTL